MAIVLRNIKHSFYFDSQDFLAEYYNGTITFLPLIAELLAA